MKIIALGWVLAFLGGIDLVAVVVVTTIRSLSASSFIWTSGQTVWAIVGGVLVVLGPLMFVGGMVKAASD